MYVLCIRVEYNTKLDYSLHNRYNSATCKKLIYLSTFIYIYIYHKSGARIEKFAI